MEIQTSRFFYIPPKKTSIPSTPSTDTLHNPSYLSEIRLPINAAFCKLTHSLEEKVQEFGIYKTTYPDGISRNPKISDKTDLDATF